MASSLSIHAAATEGNLDQIRHLLESDVSLGPGDDKDGLTPLMCAIKNGHKEVAALLVSHMSIPSLSVITSSDKWNALHWMAAWGRPWPEVWKEIQRKCPHLWDQRDGNDKRPIDKAREHRNRSQRHRQLYQALEGNIQDEYIKGISTKVEKKCNITVTLTGHEGVGKTCLVEQLRNKNIPPQGPPSTDTARLLVKHLTFDPETYQKEAMEEGSELKVGIQRIQRVMTCPDLEVAETRMAETDGTSATRGQQNMVTAETLPSAQGNMQTREMSLTPKQEKEIEEYNQFMIWLEECRNVGAKVWEEKRHTEFPSREDQRLTQKFLLVFSRSIKRKSNYCSSCSVDCDGQLWYRCQQCVDTNICSECYRNGRLPDKEHESNHTMVYTGHTSNKYRCRGCDGICLDTYFKCKTCKDLFGCLGCCHSGKFDHTTTHPMVKESRVNYAARVTSDQQYEFAKKVMPSETGSQSKPKGLVTIYDFGGEKIFYNTHHCIVTDDMIFILVFDVSICLHPDQKRREEGYDRIEFWLRSIAASAIDEAAKTRGTPPIILIGSHMDLLPGSEEEKEEKFSDIINRLKSNPEIKTIIRHHVKDMIHVSNLHKSSRNRDVFDQIWKAIFDAARFQSQWEKEIPARWLALEHELIKNKTEGIKLLEFQDFMVLNKTLAVPLKDAKEIFAFLRYLKTTGYFLCFGLDDLNESIEVEKGLAAGNHIFIILDPQWIISAFKCIITAPKFKTNLSIKEKEEWDEYAESGKLPIHFMKSLLEKEHEQHFIRKFNFICIVMETLGLISSPLLESDTELEEYIVPCMLKEANPSYVQTILEIRSTIVTPVLCIKFEKDFIPQAIWDKTIAKCIHRFTRMSEGGYDPSEFVRRGFVCLSINGVMNVILNCHKNAMKVILFTRNVEFIPPGKVVKFREFLESLLQNVLEMNHQGHFKYNYYFHNDYEFSKVEKMVKKEELSEFGKVLCEGGKGPKQLCKRDYRIWFQDHQSQCEPDDDVIVDTLPPGLHSKRPTAKELGRISNLIGKNYQSFFIQLGCPKAMVDRFDRDFQLFSFRVRITRTLITFLNKNSKLRFPHIALALKEEEDKDVEQLLDVLDVNGEDLDFPTDVLEKQLSTEHLSVVSEYISPRDSFLFFLELDLKVNSIERKEARFADLGERIMALLELWIDLKGDKGEAATVKEVLLAMRECHMDTEGLVRALEENF
ncbi:uncharacterized protein [Argopecten irradians]|uniref:uncharacterized protein n=1 Tax=Argopecten irradians TaxID=31199 RepID=UPI00371C985A